MNSYTNSGASSLSTLVISLHLAKDEKGAQSVLLVIGIVGICIAILVFFSMSHTSNPPVPQAQLQQSILKMKEVPVQIRSHA